jgi:G3E family GTPase
MQLHFAGCRCTPHGQLAATEDDSGASSANEAQQQIAYSDVVLLNKVGCKHPDISIWSML